MHRIFHLMWCVWQCGEFHSITGKQHTSALTVCYRCPTYTNLVSAFLWNHVFCHIIFYFVLVDTQFCAFASVHIGFFRSHAVPGYIVIICIEFEHNTEFRHITQTFYRIIRQCGADASVTVYLIAQFTLSCRSCWHRISKCNLCAVIQDFDFRNMHSRIMSSGRIFVRQIHGCQFPLSAAHLHQTSVIVVDRCTPEVWSWNHLDHFHSTVTVRSKTAVQVREEHIEVFTANTKVMTGIDHFEFCRFYSFYRCLYFVNTLSECHFMTTFCPYGIFFQTEGYSNCVFTRQCLYRNRQTYSFLAQRSYMSFHRNFFDLFSVFRKHYEAVKGICVDKQVLIDDCYLIFFYFCRDVLIVEFHILHLGRCVSFSTVCDTVSAEVVVAWTIIEVTAVCLEFFSVTVFFVDGLIDVIPDKSTLVGRLGIGQICVFVHTTAGVTHCMRVLAADKWFASVFFQEFFDSFY